MAIMLNKKTTDKFLKILVTDNVMNKLVALHADVKIGGGQITILHKGIVTVQADLKSNTAMAVVLGKCSKSVVEDLISKVGELLTGFYEYHQYNLTENPDKGAGSVMAGNWEAAEVESLTDGFQLEGSETGHIDTDKDKINYEVVAKDYEAQLSTKVDIANAELIGCAVSGTNSSSTYYAVIVEGDLKIAIRIKETHMVSIRVYFKGDISKIIQAIHLTKSGGGTHLMSTHLKCKNITEVVSLIGALYFVASTFYGVSSMLPVNSLLAANEIAQPDSAK